MKTETFDEKTGFVTVKKNGFCYMVDGYDAKSVLAYNDKGPLPLLIRDYALPVDKAKELDCLPFARWEALCEMADNLANRN